MFLFPQAVINLFNDPAEIFTDHDFSSLNVLCSLAAILSVIYILPCQVFFHNRSVKMR